MNLYPESRSDRIYIARGERQEAHDGGNQVYTLSILAEASAQLTYLIHPRGCW